MSSFNIKTGEFKLNHLISKCASWQFPWKLSVFHMHRCVFVLLTRYFFNGTGYTYTICSTHGNKLHAIVVYFLSWYLVQYLNQIRLQFIVWEKIFLIANINNKIHNWRSTDQINNTSDSFFFNFCTIPYS